MSESIETKKCSHCKTIFRLDSFNKNRATRDGFDCWCKFCRFEFQHQYRQTEKGRQAIKRYNHTKKAKNAQQQWRTTEQYRVYRRSHKYKQKISESTRQVKRRYRQRNPEKSRAQRVANYAIVKGLIPKPITLLCGICQNDAQQYHHWSYAPKHWLDVIPVCFTCHGNLHRLSFQK